MRQETQQILVVTPQHDEFLHLVNGMRQNHVAVKPIACGFISGAEVSEFQTTVAVGGNGKAQFAAQTQYLLARIGDVRLVVCAGAAGALTGEVSTGDVVVATHTVEHDYRERFLKSPLPTHAGDLLAISQLRTFAATFESPFRIHFGAIASGDEDIVDCDRARELRSITGALCVAWEGSGGSEAQGKAGADALPK